MANKIVRELRLEILASAYLAPLSTRFLPWTTAALRPSIIMAILNDIIIKRRTTIVECGGGISTIYIGRLLKERGGHLHTIEEDPAWAKLLSLELEAEGLLKVVTVVCAPLADSRFFLNGGGWYDEAKVRDAVTGRVDLLIVDGPSVGLVRFPAVPFFRPCLADDYTIFLDDIPRGGREFLAKWEAELNMTFRVIGDYAIGTTDPSIKVFVQPV